MASKFFFEVKGGEAQRRKRWRGLKKVRDPSRINIPENRGESEMYRYDASAEETRPLISSVSTNVWQGCFSVVSLSM